MKEKDKLKRSILTEMECEHIIRVKFDEENNAYISYCKKCGKIFDMVLNKTTHIQENSTKIGFYKKYERRKRK